MRIALDTNILAYAEGINGEERQQQAISALRTGEDEIVIPAQALGELYAVLTRKGGRARDQARAAVLTWADGYEVIGTSPSVMRDALDLATHHRLACWDAVMLAAAAEAGCRVLLSEDFQAGFTWRGVTVRNPFDQITSQRSP